MLPELMMFFWAWRWKKVNFKGCRLAVKTKTNNALIPLIRLYAAERFGLLKGGLNVSVDAVIVAVYFR